MKTCLKTLILFLVLGLASCEEDETLKPEPAADPQKCEGCGGDWD